MILRQFLHADPVAAFCLVGCGGRVAKGHPDHIEVLPGVYSGSCRGRLRSGEPTSAIGSERRNNKALRIEDEETIARAMLADIPRPPRQAALTLAANPGLATGADL